MKARERVECRGLRRRGERAAERDHLIRRAARVRQPAASVKAGPVASRSAGAPLFNGSNICSNTGDEAHGALADHPGEEQTVCAVIDAVALSQTARRIWDEVAGIQLAGCICKRKCVDSQLRPGFLVQRGAEVQTMAAYGFETALTAEVCH